MTPPTDALIGDVSTALDLVQSLFVGLDRDGRVVYANRLALDVLGRAEADLVGRDWFESCVPAEERAEIRRSFERVVGTGSRHTVQVAHGAIRGDGRVVEVEWQQVALRRSDGAVVGVLVSGLEVGSASALRDSRRELEQIKYALDQAAIVARTDRRGVIDFVNDKFCEISGFSREELIGSDHRILNSGYHDRAFMKNLWATIGRGGVWRGEIRNRAKNGNHYWVDTTIVPLLGSDGVPQHYLAIRSDITERKLQEERLRQQDALAAVGQMAAVVAHEIKNPLMGISGALQVVSGRLPTDSRERLVIGEVRARVAALNTALESLLDFTRPKAPRPIVVGLRPLVETAVANIRANPAYREVDIAVRVPDECVVRADPEQVTGAVLNLLLNAAQACDGAGHIDVSVRCQPKWAWLTVADDGPGIAPAARDRVFEPFFSTRKAGTGLGLAMVRRTVEDHGGRISVTCPEGGGTVVELSLPRP